ncbi:hypothetical protein [Cytobacillus firmus]|uniref:Uncharacterized protein n=1 Tax=Cytobacillus firmus DS1 TaxID=1307436 RepID=W7L8H9_CYTFI|nr:hypothetical protein [Cytobacillus firmus]EWG11572.1 hypothetical protein PBF_08468 [Cytobacillus firmus DS1]
MKKTKHQLTDSTATRKLQITIVLCSIIFTIGTAIHNFVIINPTLIETMMQMAGVADPAGEAIGFTFGFRIVGCIYIIGNALGILALYSRSRILWWVILAVNITQAAGPIMIPSSMWTAVTGVHGVLGILPSAITDGGAIILSLVMIISMFKFRTIWAKRPSYVKN